ncbi:MAG: Guanine nucleotide exchange factor lte1 [Pycnora praestabilis]|nr:MAG: Guanine nucleotide exchange factor lte1 [Pycnora praestabilis]
MGELTVRPRQSLVISTTSTVRLEKDPWEVSTRSEYPHQGASVTELNFDGVWPQSMDIDHLLLKTSDFSLLSGPSEWTKNPTQWRSRSKELMVTITDTQQTSDLKQNAERAPAGSSISVKRKLSDAIERRGRRNSIRNAKNSTEELRKRSVTRSSANVVTDGGSASRTGRQFTVGGVGNNGRIYLRPVVRPTQERPKPPPFVFPQASAPGKDTHDSHFTNSSSIHPRDSLWSGTRTIRTPRYSRRRESSASQAFLHSASPSLPRTIHQRARSFSSVNEHSKVRDTEVGAYRVVIDRLEEGRPKTANQVVPYTLQNIPIPHYRLGRPRFSAGGSAFLRSSAYTRASTAEEMGSSVFSRADYEKLFPAPPGTAPGMHSQTPSHTHHVQTKSRKVVNLGSTCAAAPTYHQPQAPISSAIYDALGKNPDDDSLVRYSPTTGEISAATIPRIIAQITSPNFLDYELLSDFFLIFRSFLSTEDLTSYLVARLRWAVHRRDESGRIVRVRTFVAIRHWILNYFMDDFVIDYDLRTLFCNQVNKLCEDLRKRSDGGGGDLKVIGELKRCWRRTGALYWDGRNFSGDARPDEDIFPGGLVGLRDDQSTVSSNGRHGVIDAVPPQILFGHKSAERSSSTNDWLATNSQASPTISPRYPYSAAGVSVDGVIPNQEPASPVSDHSVQVLSCSIPARRRRAESRSRFSLGAHPVPIGGSMTKSLSAAVARSPGPAGKRTRPALHGHKRSGSFSDALRDTRALHPSSNTDDGVRRFIYTAPYVGSLIRGNVILPRRSLVKEITSAEPEEELTHKDFGPTSIAGMFAGTKLTAGSSPGMKKLLGSFRRALGGKRSVGHLSALAQENGPSSMEKSVRQLTHSTSQSNSEKDIESREGKGYSLRIDILATAVADHFDKAIEGLMDVDTQRFKIPRRRSRAERGISFLDDTDSDTELQEKIHVPSQVTLGSQSIVIIDDTRPDQSIMSGALQAHNSMDLLKQKSIALPSVLAGTSQPMQSSQVKPLSPIRSTSAMNRLKHSTSVSLTALTDRATLSKPQEAGAVGQSPPSLLYSPSVPSHLVRGKSYKSSHSASSSLRRYASFQSGMTKSLMRNQSSDNTSFPIAGEISTNGSLDKPPGRMLKRRPGGDLRAADNVHDLETIPRPRSTGSLKAYTDSFESFVLRPSDDGAKNNRESSFPHASRLDPVVSSFINIDKKAPVSLVRTHSSQPNMRPSFEAEVAKLAKIPDDDDDDGGIESALLKLEGKYEKRPSERSSPVPTEQHETIPAKAVDVNEEPRLLFEQDEDRLHPTGQNTSSETSDSKLALHDEHDRVGNFAYTLQKSPALGSAAISVDVSEDSYCSVPILERGLSMQPKRSQPDREWSEVSVPRPLFSRSQSAANADRGPSRPSIDYVAETESIRRIARGSLVPESIANESFLLDEDEDFSELSSEMSMEDTNHMDGGLLSHPTVQTANPSGEAVEAGPFSHPLRHPPSPPLTLGEAPSISSRLGLTRLDVHPPTPGLTPENKSKPQDTSHTQKASSASTIRPLEATQSAPPRPNPPSHMPFILAYDSEVLAQQFTLVEKDALSEIDWKELVEGRWKSTPSKALNWVDFLKSDDIHGVDVVIGRFNIVTKWALSECVLTLNMEERARTIIKYIHIAAHCKRYRNYATMFQITIALLSVDCSRLSKTWELVPSADIQILEELEALVQPMRNFQNLRVEMEMVTGNEGCIPFLGIYQHDLMYNSQKPSQIGSSANGEPLINFERYQATASIVKSLLRLLEASSNYTFESVEEVLSPCLWMATLSDDDIRKRSKELE